MQYDVISKSRKMIKMGRVTCTEEIRNKHNISVSKPARRKLSGRPRCRRENNIKIDHKNTGKYGLIYLVQEKGPWPELVSTIMDNRVLYKMGISCAADRILGS